MHRMQDPEFKIWKYVLKCELVVNFLASVRFPICVVVHIFLLHFIVFLVLLIIPVMLLLYSISGEHIHYDTPTNPAAPARIPGGSSSGASVAVAAKFVDFSLGESFISQTMSICCQIFLCGLSVHHSASCL